MATGTLPRYASLPLDDAQRETSSASELLQRVLVPLASLKLTVVLLAMAIFLVFAGTLAQAEKDIWDVMYLYFRRPIAFIEFKVFFPKSFFPPEVGQLALAETIRGGFYFPGGFLIGGLMAVNLLAAHGLRFTVQAKGNRLWGGLALIAVGVALTALIVIGGPGTQGFEGESYPEWDTLWGLTKIGLAALWVANAWALFWVDPSKKLQRRALLTSGVLLGAILVSLLFVDNIVLGDSSMRILWQLIKATLAGLVLLAGCVTVFRKRAGIVLLHAGLGLMMANELVVYFLHDEGQMAIREGQAVNFVQDIRKAELAIVSPSAEQDEVIAVPGSLLKEGKPIQDDTLPFDIEVVRFLQNSELRAAKGSESNLATDGLGRRWIAEPLTAVSGAGSGGAVDQPSAYVRLSDKQGKVLGTYLLNVATSSPEKVTVDGKTYDTYLRFKRNYKDYSVRLIDFRKDDYLGTSTVRNFSSDIRLVDANRGVDREIKIWMNNPLRYAGETFYQSSFQGSDVTLLQVVKNDGWMIPYVACMIVGIGMLAQFMITLTRFLKRKLGDETTLLEGPLVDGDDPVPARHRRADRRKAKSRVSDDPPVPAFWQRSMIVVPLAVVLVFGGWLVSKVRTPSTKPGQMNLYEFGKLPLVYQGRVKPFDTLARNTLRIISDKEELVDFPEEKKVDAGKEKAELKTEEKLSKGDKTLATRWLLDVISGAPGSDPHLTRAEEHRIFRIEHQEVLDTLGLTRRKGFRYSVAELRPKIEEFNRQVKDARKAPAERRSLYQRKLMDLDGRIRTFTLIAASFQPLEIPPYPTSEELAKDPQGAARKFIMQVMMTVSESEKALMAEHPPLAVPAKEGDHWDPYSTALTRAYLGKTLIKKEPNPAVLALNKIFDAYERNDVDAFNSEVKSYQEALAASPPADLNMKKVDFEAFFNHFAPFYHAAALYVVAFVLVAISWLGWTKQLGRSAFWLILLTLAVHTFALAARIYISGRPPVTNLYSSAVFIGWGCVMLGIVLELIYRLGIGNIIAAVAGFNTLLIAHFLAGDGDTFTVLQAVLDTQFWLATHVVCITLGYATTFLAGIIGLIYIIRGYFTPSLTPSVAKDLSRMIYGTLCFAMFFSFVGTVLGGLWADDSWGRFWGWDPKENGALMIVLWNALVLHARWGGMIKERGLAVLSLGGNIVTSWSWFGVNELGVGLHSYGFTDGVLRAMALFIGSQLILMAIGSLPKTQWWSFRAADGVTPCPSSKSAT